LFANRGRIAELAAESKLATACPTREWVQAGGLMSYAPSYSDLFRRAATYVHRILKGERPSELPVEQPTKFELVLNLKTAKILGLNMPTSLLLRADEVIE
jgi:putative ABC transport system substrate-binding protein